ncbi:MAG: ATP-dependent DNA helicase RecQ [Acholeplasmatales bacterium]|nr:ATP-dependent DNA helicase RecQ [Acholeplasmatales bacterium]
MNKVMILNSYFGLKKLKPEQEEIIDLVMEGKDVIGLLPTGFGKSVTFVIPALMLEGITIVITPLISLMQDQVKNLKAKGIKADFISSLLDRYEIDSVFYRLQSGKIKILYVAGERLLSQKFLYVISKINVSFIVVDEAHTLLWSEDFRYSLSKISDFVKKIKIRPRLLALTATATPTTTDKIIDIFGLDHPKIIKINCDRENIFYKIVRTNNKNKYLSSYIKEHIDEKGIIYCLTINACECVFSFLSSLGYDVSIYHGKLKNEAKKKAYEDFKSGRSNLIVCTNAFGMGIDIPNIRFVIEYDLPASIEDFSQQTGRASRDGKYGEGIILYSEHDIATLEYFIENIYNEEKNDKEIDKIKKEHYHKLDSIISLCISNRCVHKTVSNYFGFDHKGNCMMCSNCKRS